MISPGSMLWVYKELTSSDLARIAFLMTYIIHRTSSVQHGLKIQAVRVSDTLIKSFERRLEQRYRTSL